jgi:hypothetical protein
MKGVGAFLIGLGILAIVFHFFEKVPGALSWIYNWGDGVAWAIMIGLVVLGIILLMAAARRRS